MVYNSLVEHPTRVKRKEYTMDKYASIKELTLGGYDFVNKALQNGVENGKYPLEDGAYAVVSEYETKSVEDAKFEAHKKFIDVQLILSGREVIGVMPTERMRLGNCIGEYNPEKDVELYRECGDYDAKLLEAGDFLILYPEDGHMPGVHADGPCDMKKIVLKIPV